MKPLPKSLLKFLAKHPTMFEEGWSEQDGYNEKNRDGWAHWVYLKHGFHNGDVGSHIIHECSVKEVKRAWRFVAPCACDDCKNFLTANAA
jgi:hypothetical protein